MAPPRPLEPRLIVITDTALVGRAQVVARVRSLVAMAQEATVLVQLRDRELSARERLELGRELRELTRRHGQWFAVGDRIDLALALEADGLHLGEQSVPVAAARELWGSRFVSRAVHDLAALEAGGADALLLSPIVAPRKGNSALGIDALTRARARLSARGQGGTLLAALGGVGPETAAQCLAAGANAVAVIGAALRVEDPRPLLAAVGALTG